MRICRGAVPVFGLLVLILAGAGGVSRLWSKHQEPEYVIRTTSRLVLLDVSVKDAAGGLVPGLAQQNFDVYEDGKLQKITQFAHSDIPVTVGLVVDASGSMRRKQNEVITAALVFIQASNPKDETFVINFNETVQRGLPEPVLFSDDVTQLRSALWRGVAEGRTALYDAIETALRQLDQGRRDKKTLIVLSDGGDNVSAHRFSEVMHDVLDSVATIFTIGIYEPEDPDRNPGVLKRIATVSGGNAYFPERLEEIVPICRDIARDIRARYTIGYVPTESDKTSERHVKVVARSAGQKLSVTTRTRYLFTPDSR